MFPNLTVAQNVAAGIGKEVSKGDRDAIVGRELKRFGLEGFDKRYPAQLSGGQQQRVALARMLAARPGILMLDEPFSALDAHLKEVLEQNLVSLFDASGGTVLYVSHDIDEALRFCDRIAVVDAGRIMEIDSGDDLVNNPRSVAALKLSGCKNATPVERVDDRHVWSAKWGVTVEVDGPVADDVAYLGVRARYLEQVDGPGRNCFLACASTARAIRVSSGRCCWVPRSRRARGSHGGPGGRRDEVPAPAYVLARSQGGRRRAAAWKWAMRYGSASPPTASTWWRANLRTAGRSGRCPRGRLAGPFPANASSDWRPFMRELASRRRRGLANRPFSQEVFILL